MTTDPGSGTAPWALCPVTSTVGLCNDSNSQQQYQTYQDYHMLNYNIRKLEKLHQLT
jgi:hypothetical protein